MIKSIIQAMRVKGHLVFENDSKPYNLNYIGIRDESSVGKFNDRFVIFWKYKGVWSYLNWMGTTDPGLYYLDNPLNVKGTAILKEGQMRGAFMRGFHKGNKDHPCLVQRKEVIVIRDANRDNVLDTHNGIEDLGFHGINHHQSHKKGEVKNIGRFSAGCQVTWNPHEYDVFNSITGESEEIWGPALTYTLININDLKH